jgi:hypothetical protein
MNNIDARRPKFIILRIYWLECAGIKYNEFKPQIISRGYAQVFIQDEFVIYKYTGGKNV